MIYLRQLFVCLFLSVMSGVFLGGLSACSSGGGSSSPPTTPDDPTPPKPDTATLTCESCHGTPIEAGGSAEKPSIEHAHPQMGLSCVDCHGGTSPAFAKEDAHVNRPEGLENAAALKALTLKELDEVDPAYVQWVNPSDYRVVENTCGQSECHQDIARVAPTSIMTTFAGHFNKSRYYAGSQDTRAGIFGVRDQEALPGAVPSETAAPYTVEAHQQFFSPVLDENSSLGDFQDHYLEKSCPKCHVGNYGATDIPGDYRSSGCAGCHMVYANNGLSRSGDPTAEKEVAGHPILHVLTTAIPDEQCEHCHYRGNRIGTMFRGVREKGRLDESEYIGTMNQSLHGHSPSFYVDDEDLRNQVDETPPDVHAARGMGCVDCHMGADVHGDGNLYGAHDAQVGIECTDCHGTPEAMAAPAEDGKFYNDGGSEMRNLRNTSFGPVLTGRLDGRPHVPPQLMRSAQTNTSPEFIAAHGRDENGFSHLDSMECFACHSSWTQSCLGCHVTVDTRADGKSLITGEMSPGVFASARSWVVTDYLPLGIAMDGQITPMAPQEKMFFTAIVPCDPEVQTCDVDPDSESPGKKVYDHKARRTYDGKLGFGFGPVVPHTVAKEPQPCDRCHLREDESNWNIINETIGYGSGRFQIPEGDGTLHDLTKVMDAEGNSLVGLAHEGSDVLPQAVIARMLKPRVANSGLTLKTVGEWVPIGEEPPVPAGNPDIPPEEMERPDECVALAEQTPSLTLGMGSNEFLPFQNGNELAVFPRAQGAGLLTFISLRIDGMYPGDPDNFSDRSNPRFTMTLVAEDGTELNEGIQRSRGFRTRASGELELVGEVIDLFLLSTLQADGLKANLSVSLSDACGASVNETVALELFASE